MSYINKLLNSLLNDSYWVLKIIYDKQLDINYEKYCPLSQEEIAKEMGVTRMTVSNIIKKLRENGLIIVENSRRYKLTPEAEVIIKKIEKI